MQEEVHRGSEHHVRVTHQRVGGAAHSDQDGPEEGSGRGRHAAQTSDVEPRCAGGGSLQLLSRRGQRVVQADRGFAEVCMHFKMPI